MTNVRLEAVMLNELREHIQQVTSIEELRLIALQLVDRLENLKSLQDVVFDLQDRMDDLGDNKTSP